MFSDGKRVGPYFPGGGCCRTGLAGAGLPCAKFWQSKPRACGEEKMEPPAPSPCDLKLGRPGGSSSGCGQGCLADRAMLLPAQLGLRLGPQDSATCWCGDLGRIPTS